VQRVIGCVVYPAAELLSPGSSNTSRVIGFPLASRMARKRAQRPPFGVLHKGGLQAPVLSDIPCGDLAEALGQFDVHPISALSRRRSPASVSIAQPRHCGGDDDGGAVVAGKLGITFRVVSREANCGAERVGHHKTSMLQGCRGRAHARNRRAAGFGGGTGPN